MFKWLSKLFLGRQNEPVEDMEVLLERVHNCERSCARIEKRMDRLGLPNETELNKLGIPGDGGSAPAVAVPEYRPGQPTINLKF